MFLVPTLTFETPIYIVGLCLEIQNNGRCVRKYHSDVVKHCFNEEQIISSCSIDGAISVRVDGGLGVIGGLFT